MNDVLTNINYQELLKKWKYEKNQQSLNMLSKLSQKNTKYHNQLISDFKKHSRESLVDMLHKLFLKTWKKLTN